MNNVDWVNASIDLLQTIIGGVIVAIVIFWLDERRARRDRKLSDFRIASNWFATEPKISLRGFDLGGKNLSGYKFIGANLEEVTFKNSKMWATDFSRANLRKTDFRNTKIVGAKFIKVVALLADFSNSVIKSRNEPDYEYVPDFTEAVLVYCKFRNSWLEGALMSHADLKKTDFTGATVLNCDFSGANLSESMWKRVRRVENCVWKNVRVGDKENFPDFLWKEIQEQNAKPSKKRRNAN